MAHLSCSGTNSLPLIEVRFCIVGRRDFGETSCFCVGIALGAWRRRFPMSAATRMLVVGGWGDRQNLADRLDPVVVAGRASTKLIMASIGGRVLTLRKIRGGLAQNLIGLAQLAVLALELSQPLPLVRREPGTSALVTLRLLHTCGERLRLQPIYTAGNNEG